MAESGQLALQGDARSTDSASYNSRSQDLEQDRWAESRDYSNSFGIDLSYLELDDMTVYQNIDAFTASETDAKINSVLYLYLQFNRLAFLPNIIYKFRHLRHLDLSSNQLNEINDNLLQVVQLQVLVLRNNLLREVSLPKKLGMLQHLEEINLSGNLLRTIPAEIIDVQSLKCLYLGGNQIDEIPRDIWKLKRLEVLYLGGNNLKEIPAEMGRLHSLRSLVLCENQLQSLPSTISCLQRLRSLLLHKNQLTTLPPELLTLKFLVELSLRDNPLVVRFVEDLTYDPPSLQELAARCIKILRVQYNPRDIPGNLLMYLQSACRCVNPKCQGVYFDNRVEHIKFVDFCGKYRIPLLQYLCSPRCTIQPTYSSAMSDTNSSDDENGSIPSSRMKRVLLG